MIKTDSQSRKKYSKFIKLVGILLLVFFIVEIWMVNRLSTYGQKIAQIKSTQGALELENQILETAIAEKSSLKSIQLKAAGLGFYSIKEIDFIKPDKLALIK